jgi:fructokinase
LTLPDREAPIVSIGELLIDLIVADDSPSLDDAETLTIQPGGAPANVAVGLAKLGTPSGFCGVVGNDSFGQKLRRTLNQFGVDASRLRTTGEAATTVALAWKDARGDGHFQIIRMADALLSPEDVEQATLPETAGIVVGSVSLTAQPSRQAIERAVGIASGAGIPVCFDINIRPTLWGSVEEAREACAPILQAASLIKLSLDDAAFLFGDESSPQAVFDHLAAHPANVIVLTDGARGAWYCSNRRDAGSTIEHVPAMQIDAVDPTGAGDAFMAALISRLARRGWSGIDVDDVRYASAAGALTAAGRGAMASMPRLDEIEAFLGSRPHQDPVELPR